MLRFTFEFSYIHVSYNEATYQAYKILRAYALLTPLRLKVVNILNKWNMQLLLPGKIFVPLKNPQIRREQDMVNTLTYIHSKRAVLLS